MLQKNKSFDFFVFLLNVRVRFIAFILSFFYIIWIFWFVLKDFRTEDPIPQLKSINIDILKRARSFSSDVRIGLMIKNFPTFDLAHNNFIIDALVWFEFAKDEIMIDTIGKFTVDNGRIISKSEPLISFIDGKISVRYDIIFELKTSLDFHRYPLEDHRLSIVLLNNHVNIDEIHFNEEPRLASFKISDHVFVSNWKIQELQHYTGFFELQYDKANPSRIVQTPKAAFIMGLRKDGINKILIIFIPLFAAVFFSLFTFLMSFNSYQGKTTLALTAVTAILGYRFVIQQMSPAVSYFTLSDKIFLFFLVLSFFILLFQIVLLRHYMFLMDRERVKKSEQAEPDTDFWVPKITERVNSVVYFASLLILVVGVTWIIL